MHALERTERFKVRRHFLGSIAQCFVGAFTAEGEMLFSMEAVNVWEFLRCITLRGFRKSPRHVYLIGSDVWAGHRCVRSYILHQFRTKSP